MVVSYWSAWNAEIVHQTLFVISNFILKDKLRISVHSGWFMQSPASWSYWCWIYYYYIMVKVLPLLALVVSSRSSAITKHTQMKWWLIGSRVLLQEILYREGVYVRVFILGKGMPPPPLCYASLLLIDREFSGANFY